MVDWNVAIALGTLALLLANLVFTLRDRAQRASQEDLEKRDRKIEATDAKLQGHAVRLKALEESIKHLPTHSDVKELSQGISDVKEILARNAEQTKGVGRDYEKLDRRLARIEGFLDSAASKKDVSG